jgi:polyisoprenoid-binding protein YceI
MVKLIRRIKDIFLGVPIEFTKLVKITGQYEQNARFGIVRGMDKRMTFTGILIFWVVLGFGQIIDTDNSVVIIKASHGDGSPVEGTITGMEGTIRFDPENLDMSKFEVCIDPGTILTGKGMRDGHLKGKQFLAVKKFPLICYVSEQFIPTDKGYITTGELTIKDATQRVSIPFTFDSGVFTGSIEFDRYDYDVGNDNEKRVAPRIRAEITCVLLPEN